MRIQSKFRADLKADVIDFMYDKDNVAYKAIFINIFGRPAFYLVEDIVSDTFLELAVFGVKCIAGELK